MKPKTRIGVEIDTAICAIDAGHGGMLMRKFYTTAGKQFKDFHEGEINRLYAFELSNQLYLNDVIGFELIENCPVDVSLKDRIKTLNLLASKRNNCVSNSIHCNAAGNGKDWHPAMGSVIFYNAFDKESKKLAQCISARIDTDEIPIVHRGIKPTKSFGMVRKPNMPSALTELGFMTNKADHNALKDSQVRQKYCALIAAGTGDYFKQRV